jgi:ATP-dependent exoDNAse (exonuclease V) beta subunit
MKNAKEEARKISEIIEAEIKKGRALKDICVLFRAHQYGRVIKKALEAKGIVYCSVSKQSLFKQQSVRIVINYLRILEKIAGDIKGGEDSWWDLVYSSGFLENDLVYIGKFMKENQGKNISKVLMEHFGEIGFSDDGKLKMRIIIERLKLLTMLKDKNVEEIVKEVYRLIGVGVLGDEQDKDEREIIMNLNKFYELSKKHSELYENSLSGFIYYLDILSKLGIEVDAVEIEEGGVRLMTLHATKGLEFKVVIVSNLAQKRFPIERYGRSSLIPLELFPEIKCNKDGKSDELILEYEKKHSLMEERRLCYVAFTRAKENLFLTYALDYGGKKAFPSKFLDEIKFKKSEDIAFSEDRDDRWHEQEITASHDEKKEKKEREILLKRTLSPSALLLFEECQKKFEYKYVYNMPEPKTISWEAMRLGSFVHKILEKGVKDGFDTIIQFKELAYALSLEDEWKGVELEDALVMVEVFFERNKGKYSKKSMTEQELNMILGGLRFHGFADRIDFGEKGIEIIDYKTGKSDVSPQSRNWQLGYYALAASKLGRVRKVVLEMLRHEKPLEFEIDDKGNAVLVHEGSRMKFNIYEVEEELVKCAADIHNAYENGFKPCPIEKNCEFCQEYVYGL